MFTLCISSLTGTCTRSGSYPKVCHPPHRDSAGLRQWLMFCPGLQLPHSPLFAMQMKPTAELCLALLAPCRFLLAQASLQSLFCPSGLSSLSGVAQCLACASRWFALIAVLSAGPSAQSQKKNRSRLLLTCISSCCPRLDLRSLANSA